MKNLNCLNKYRIPYLGSMGDEHNGAFKIYVGGRSFIVIASDGGGWDHVSVSPRNAKRCPTWNEMCEIKKMFFEPEETIIEYHPPESDYINIHPYCLHLWRPQNQDIPTPPKWMV
jgi:hypothetical protein